MKNNTGRLALAAALACALSTPAAAQAPGDLLRSKTQGFNAAVFMNGSAIQVEGSETVESGSGASVHLGYGISPNVLLFVRTNGAIIASFDYPGESYTLSHFDLGARYSFGTPEAAARPYVEAALSGRAFYMDLGSRGAVDARGPTATFAGGLEYFVTPSLALQGGLAISSGQFSEGRENGGEWQDFGDGSFNATSTRFDLGVSWHP